MLEVIYCHIRQVTDEHFLRLAIQFAALEFLRIGHVCGELSITRIQILILLIALELRLNDAGDGSIKLRHTNGLEGLVYFDNLLTLLIDDYSLYSQLNYLLQRVFTCDCVIPFDTLLR